MTGKAPLGEEMQRVQGTAFGDACLRLKERESGRCGPWFGARQRAGTAGLRAGQWEEGRRGRPWDAPGKHRACAEGWQGERKGTPGPCPGAVTSLTNLLCAFRPGSTPWGSSAFPACTGWPAKCPASSPRRSSRCWWASLRVSAERPWAPWEQHVLKAFGPALLFRFLVSEVSAKESTAQSATSPWEQGKG